MSSIDKILDFDNQPVSQIVYTMIKWLNVDNVTMDFSYRKDVESGVWISIKITRGENSWYVDGQRLDIIKDRLIGWHKRNNSKP